MGKERRSLLINRRQRCLHACSKTRATTRYLPTVVGTIDVLFFIVVLFCFVATSRTGENDHPFWCFLLFYFVKIHQGDAAG